MKINVTNKVGKAQLVTQIEGKDLKDTLFKASAVTDIPSICGVCGNTDVTLAGNMGGGFPYVKIRCNNSECKATATLGSYQDDSGFFWKRWEVYVRDGEENNSNVKSDTSSRKTVPVKAKEEDIEEDDMPF